MRAGTLTLCCCLWTSVYSLHTNFVTQTVAVTKIFTNLVRKMDFCRILGYVAVLVIYSMIGISGALKATNLAREVICEGCHAVVTEANALLSSSKRSSAQVRQAVMNVCQVNRLTKYEFSPPNMVKACDYWRNNYMDEVKDALAEGGDVEDQEIQLCFVETDACHNVDRSHFRINKYPGPSKSKVRAALKSEEDEEEEASEEEETSEEESEEGEVATEENREMGEEVFEDEVEEEVETVKTKDEVGDTQEDAAQEEDEEVEASDDTEEKEEDEDESREDETTEKAKKKKQDGKKQGKGKKGKDKDKKKDGSKKKDGDKKKGGDKKKDKRKDNQDEKKKQKGKKDKKDKQDKSSKKENKKKENKNKKNSEKNKGKKNKKDEL